jgi:hypothetical protein
MLPGQLRVEQGCRAARMTGERGMRGLWRGGLRRKARVLSGGYELFAHPWESKGSRGVPREPFWCFGGCRRGGGRVVDRPSGG